MLILSLLCISRFGLVFLCVFVVVVVVFFQLSDNFREMVNIMTRQIVRLEKSVSIEACFSD